jgi:hypothetical protein
MNMPEELRTRLLAAGHKQIDIGNATLDLRTGKLTRIISLDGKVVAEPEFTKVHEIEWDIVAEAVA